MWNSQDGSKDAERPHVGWVWYRSEREDLGGAVVDRREENSHRPVGVDALSNAEVRDLHVLRPRRREQNVLRLPPNV